MTATGWLWSGLGIGEWLATVVGQTLVGFLLIAALLTPAWSWLKRFYKKQTNPFTPGGAGSRTVDGREVHEILSEVRGSK